ncbi:hypothetical protein DID88_004115 [Monilinia fructigena]|uniref:RRM domain-containing protein n=1 Tax=Monilinia fructigena TaxID=38457 RepID=A0A395IRU2_9HELO|nr:hypothetical protein DID88_004115 [Monilinia fructigena]
MDMTSPTQNGGDHAVFDSFGQKNPSYTAAPSFGPSLHQKHITNHSQSRSYVPKLAISSTHNPLNHIKAQNATADSLSELITNLRIRIAVLENDLAHATKDKDEAIKSSIIIARALGNVANNPELATKNPRDPVTEELEELRAEVKRLKRENGFLWVRIESREADHIVSYDNSPNTGSRGSNTFQVSVAQDAPNHSHHTVEFNEETQLPNIVNLERLEDASLAVPSREPVLPYTYTPSRRSIHDINTSNLDDVLASENEDGLEIKIEDQLRYQERANADIPVPTVRKAGFVCTPEKAIRGDDYADYANRNNYHARFNNRNAPTGPRPFGIPPDMTEGTSIWASPQQRDDEINSHMRTCDSREFKFPDYFRHGVSFIPKEDDVDTLRGVLIGGLPTDIELRDVLARVRGGRIYSSVLLNTMSISGSNSALVTFIKQADAEAYVEYANAHPITFETLRSRRGTCRHGYLKTEKPTALKSNQISEEKATLRPQSQLHQTHSNTTSVSTLVGPSIEALRKDEDTSAAPVTPQRAPRIITGKQWLLELTTKEPSSSTSTSTFTPTSESPPIFAPSTPNFNEATPRPRLTLATTSLPPKITSESPEPSSADIQVQDHTPSPASVPSKSTNIPIRPILAVSLFSAAGHPIQSASSSQLVQPAISAQALNTFQQTIKDAGTNVYFEPEADTEKATLDSEVDSEGKSHEVRFGGNLEPEEELAAKMNPDEIDLDLESETNVEGDENRGLFQKELSLRVEG